MSDYRLLKAAGRCVMPQDRGRLNTLYGNNPTVSDEHTLTGD